NSPPAAQRSTHNGARLGMHGCIAAEAHATPFLIPWLTAFLFLGSPLFSIVGILGLKRATFGARAEALVEVDGAALDRNAGRRQASRILIDGHRLLVRAQCDAHRFQRLALVRV